MFNRTRIKAGQKTERVAAAGKKIGKEDRGIDTGTRGARKNVAERRYFSANARQLAEFPGSRAALRAVAADFI